VFVTDPSSPEAFTDEWAQAWCRALNASPAYRTAAAVWEGAVGLLMTRPGGERRAVLLDLWHGECRGARVVAPAELETARYVLEAPADTWREMLALRASPLVALMSGKLRLTRGNIAELLPYVNAAKELVTTATDIAAVFPDDAA
jgi:putative sterol carrier protein